jgi:hypothetical protein
MYFNAFTFAERILLGKYVGSMHGAHLAFSHHVILSAGRVRGFKCVDPICACVGVVTNF